MPWLADWLAHAENLLDESAIVIYEARIRQHEARIIDRSGPVIAEPDNAFLKALSAHAPELPKTDFEHLGRRPHKAQRRSAVLVPAGAKKDPGTSGARQLGK